MRGPRKGNNFTYSQMARQTYTTPEVTLEWAKVFGEPRVNKKYPKKKPAWEVDVVLDLNNEKHVQWIEWIEDQYQVHHGSRGKSTHWNPIKDDAKIKNQKRCTMRLNQFDLKNGGGKSGPPDVFAGEGIEGMAKGQPWPANVEIGNGSKGRVKFEIYPWGEGSDNGLSLNVRAIQVTEHLAFERARTAASYDFDTSEEGEALAKAAAAAPRVPTFEDADQGEGMGNSSAEDKLPWE